MRAIVFGGSGFVGSHVADALSDAGHLTTIFDCFSSPYIRDNQQFIEGNIADASDVHNAIKSQDVVYNFAGVADIDDSRNLPVETVEVNVRGNVNILEACRKEGIQRYVFASSIYVHSDAGSFYRVSKQACELYIEEYQREFGVSSTILRYGTLFGRRATDKNSVHRYLHQALSKRKITASGTGQELREYIHVSDAARLSVEVLAEEYAGEQIVLTGHHPMRYLDLLKLIREIVGSDVEIELKGQSQKSDSDLKLPTAHYSITPYTFKPRIARKLVSSYYVDMGQGLLDCLQEIHEFEQNSKDK